MIIELTRQVLIGGTSAARQRRALRRRRGRLTDVVDQLLAETAGRWPDTAAVPRRPPNSSQEPAMSTATRVPETITISGDELSADDAVTTLRRYGRWNLVKNSFIRFRYADGFTNARALALQFCLSFIPLIIAVVGLASALHQEKFGQVIIQTLAGVLPGKDNGDMVRAGRAAHP